MRFCKTNPIWHPLLAPAFQEKAASAARQRPCPCLPRGGIARPQAAPAVGQRSTPDNASCHRSLTKDSFIAGMTPVGWQWTLVATSQRKERCAQFNLERQGFVVYCPMVRRQIKHARLVSEVLRPLFPGYLFVQISQEATSWRPILSTIGVRALIRSGNRPVSADHLVSALKAL